MTVISPAETSKTRATITRVVFVSAFARLGRHNSYPSRATFTVIASASLDSPVAARGGCAHRSYHRDHADVAELGDAPGLGPGGPLCPWRFESSRPHSHRFGPTNRS